MDGDGRDFRIVQRGIDEAYACRDVLAPAPERLSAIVRVKDRVGAAIREVQIVLEKERSRRRPIPESMTESIR